MSDGLQDAKKAYDLGVDAIYLSNHGGRALDGAPPALYALLEINKFYPELVKDKKCEVCLGQIALLVLIAQDLH